MAARDENVEPDSAVELSKQSGRTPDYSRLPEPIDVQDTIASQEAAPSPDPDGGRDPERDFMLRYAG